MLDMIQEEWGVGYGVVCSRCAMPRLVVNVLSMVGKPADCWFHHEKATLTPPEISSSQSRLSFLTFRYFRDKRLTWLTSSCASLQLKYG